MSHYDSENQAPEPTKHHHGEDPAITNDAVFGTITEDGPNYRNVRTSQYHKLDPKLICTGWLARNISPHDEVSDRSGCPVYSRLLRRPRSHSRYHLHVGHRRHHHLVRLHRRQVQATPPRSLRYRRRRRSRLWPCWKGVLRYLLLASHHLYRRFCYAGSLNCAQHSV